MKGNRTPFADRYLIKMIFSCFNQFEMALVEIMAGEDCEILFIPPEPMFITEDSLASIQQKILVNMLASQRQVFLQISEHLACLSMLVMSHSNCFPRR